MLSKNDKEFIRQTIREELKEALTAFLIREITVSKCPRKNGDPEVRIEKEEVNVLDFVCGYLPLVEGAIRGVQSDVNKVVNSSQLLTSELRNTMIGLIEPLDNKQIEYEEEN